jgi:polyphosphate glucokinase
MIDRVRESVADWTYEAVALGLPCRVSGGRAVEDPPNLGPGWVGCNFAGLFGQPVRVMNDACLQALGSYDGGRMLFLSLGTAVGSALLTDRLVLSLDLGRLHVDGGRLYEVLGDEGFERLGVKKWQKAIHDLIPSLKAAWMADYVVLGGGNVRELNELLDGVRRGHNRTVVEGGRRLWEELPDPADETKTGWLIR